MITALLCTSGAGATSASAYFTNRTTGASTSLTFTAPSGTSLAPTVIQCQYEGTLP